MSAYVKPSGKGLTNVRTAVAPKAGDYKQALPKSAVTKQHGSGGAQKSAPIQRVIHKHLPLSHPSLREACSVVKGAISKQALVLKMKASSNSDPLSTDGVVDVKISEHVKNAEINIAQTIKMGRTMISSTLGNHPILVRLPISFTMTCNAAGLLAAALPIQANNLPEWASFQALFDEYKIKSVTYRFNVTATSAVFSLATTSADSALLGLGYDPADGTLPTSVRNVAELAHHKLFGSVATNSALTMQFSQHDGEPHVFHVTIPRGTLMSEVANVVTDWNGWYPTAATANTVYSGYLKAYFQSSYAVNLTPVIVGIAYYDVEFRCRT